MTLDVLTDIDPGSPITVLVVDDHVLFREGLVGYLSAQPGLKILGAVSTGAQALALLSDTRPDVVLLDLRLGAEDGLDVLLQIKARPYAPKVLIVSSHEGDAMIRRALSSGADGYVSKTVSSADLVAAIRKTYRGGRVMSPDIAKKITGKFNHTELTEREIEILEQIATGLTNKEVAANLRLTEKTVKNRLIPIFAKLNASDRTHAVVIAMERGFIVPSR